MLGPGGPPAPPVQPAGVGVPAPPAGPPAAPQLTYVDYYADDSHDASAGAYTGIMQVFAIPAPGAPGAALAPQVLADNVYASAVNDPQAFVMLCTTPQAPNGRVMLYHRLQRFQPQLGQPATPYDNQGFAFHGDLVGGQAPPTVEWLANAF